MKKLTFLLLGAVLTMISSGTFAQSGKTFKLRYKIYLNGNPNFPIKYSSTKGDKEGDVTAITYNSAGNVISTTKAVTNTWTAGTSYDFSSYIKATGTNRLFADILQSDDKSQLNLHFRNLKNIPSQSGMVTTPAAVAPVQVANETLNKAFKAGNFYIELPSRQGIKITSSAWQAGPMILPFKIYLGSRDGVHTSNVTTAVNAGFYLGTKWGSTSFNNLPAEKIATPHQKFWSVNLIAGASKIDVDAKTNINGSLNEGSTLAISPGLAFGFHYDSFAIFTALGTDLVTGKIADDWRYKKQVWFGFGIGFNIMN